MIYDPISRRLYTNDGQPLKQLYCPINKCWNQLEQDSPVEDFRTCPDCKEPIFNISLLNEGEGEGEALIQERERACVYFNPNSPNFNILARTPCDAAHRHLRVIRTARTEEEINQAAAPASTRAPCG